MMRQDKKIFSMIGPVALLMLSACASELPRVYTDGYGYTEKERPIAPAARGLSQQGVNYPQCSVDDFVINVGDRVFFDYDDTRLSMEAKQILSRQAEWLKKQPYYNIKIEGHTDARGSKNYNYALGQKRADVVRRYLMSRGLEDRKISTITYGEDRPAIRRSDDAAWAENRRAVTVLGQKK